MKTFIHINDGRKLLNSRQEVNLKCWKKDGNVMVCRNVVCTSSNYKENTFNIKFLVSGEIRKIKAVCLFEINNMEVIL
jgi:hypothetical protein